MVLPTSIRTKALLISVKLMSRDSDSPTGLAHSHRDRSRERQRARCRSLISGLGIDAVLPEM